LTLCSEEGLRERGREGIFAFGIGRKAFCPSVLLLCSARSPWRVQRPYYATLLQPSKAPPFYVRKFRLICCRGRRRTVVEASAFQLFCEASPLPPPPLPLEPDAMTISGVGPRKLFAAAATAVDALRDAAARCRRHAQASPSNGSRSKRVTVVVQLSRLSAAKFILCLSMKLF